MNNQRHVVLVILQVQYTEPTPLGDCTGQGAGCVESSGAVLDALSEGRIPNVLSWRDEVILWLTYVCHQRLELQLCCLNLHTYTLTTKCSVYCHMVTSMVH